MRPIDISKAASLVSPSPAPDARSLWRSPVPYLFGGLAAMVGLIAFAILLLACSYWRLATARGRAEGEGQNGEKQGDSRHESASRVLEEKVLVIMAGDDRPTFLAAPSVIRGSTSEGESGTRAEQTHGEEAVTNCQNLEENDGNNQ